MELGTYKVWFVQYITGAGRWVTKQPAHPSLEGAWAAADRQAEEYGMADEDIRIVEQTTINKVI
jgi:hypothetical protein